MAYAPGTIKAVISGSLTNGTNFACGFQTMVSGAPSQDNVDALCGFTSQALVSTQFAPLVALLGAGSRIQRVNAYGYNGGTVASVVGETAVGKNGTGTQSMPSQVAIVASLRSASNTRSGRGRIYMPALVLGLADGQLTDGFCGQLADMWAGFFNAILGQAGTGMPQTPVVASSKHAVSRPINAVIVDSRPDIIRHRAQGEAISASERRSVGS